jgi:hypothetical protein
MAVTMPEDWLSPAEGNRVWSAWQGDARVMR